MQNTHSFSKILITKKRKIIDIIKVNKNTNSKITFDKKYEGCGIIGIVKNKKTWFNRSKTDTKWIKINNNIPFDLSQYGVVIIKQEHKVIKKQNKKEISEDLNEVINSLKKNRDINYKKHLYKKCLKYLKWTQTKNAEKVVNEIKNELSDKQYKEHGINQANYRFFHHSFKVYQMREFVFEKAIQLLKLLNIKEKYELNNLIEICKKHEINQMIVKILEDTFDRNFNMDRNKIDDWVEDGSRLFGNFMILEKSVLSLINFIEQNQNEEGVIFGNSNTLNWDEGTIIYLWKPLTMIRYNNDFPIIKLKKSNQ